jgi:hypothetical protein
MTDVRQRRSPAGRPVRIQAHNQDVPEWVVRRRRVDRLIDWLAVSAKRAVRRWLLPRPAGAHRRYSSGGI